jgi:chromosome segregation ATPase
MIARKRHFALGGASQFIEFQSSGNCGSGASMVRPVSLWQGVHERRRSEWEQPRLSHLVAHASRLEESCRTWEAELSWRISQRKALTEKLSSMRSWRISQLKSLAEKLWYVGRSASRRDRVASSIRAEDERIDDTRRKLAQVREKIANTKLKIDRVNYFIDSSRARLGSTENDGSVQKIF